MRQIKEKKNKKKEEKYKVIYDLPVTSKEDQITVSVRNSAGKTYQYKIFKQFVRGYGEKDEFLMWHGCATSALTTLLISRVPQLKDYDPDDTICKIESKIFLEKAVKHNYSKELELQRPVSLYGMTKILKAYHIKHKYVHRFNKKSAEKKIKVHLKKGNPVLITVKKENGQVRIIQCC